MTSSAVKSFADRRHPENKVPLLGTHLLASWVDLAPSNSKPCAEHFDTDEQPLLADNAREASQEDLGFDEEDGERFAVLDENFEFEGLQQILDPHSPEHVGDGGSGWADPDDF